MKPFVAELLERLADGTYTQGDIDYVYQYMFKQMQRRRISYNQQMEALRKQREPQPIDFNLVPLYIKRRESLALYIAKELVVLEHDSVVLATCRLDKTPITCYFPKLTASVIKAKLITRHQEHFFPQFSSLFPNSIKHKVDFDDLQGAVNRITELLPQQEKLYTRADPDFWSVTLF